jgi:hypothetical protein
MSPSRSSAVRTGSTPSTRRCSPTLSVSPYWWCWRHSLPPSGSRSSSTTCSRCRFDEIAPIVGRSPAAARQLASRARRVQGAAVPDADLTRQREVVDAFLGASRDADFDALVALLDPDVVLRVDRGAAPRRASQEVRGVRAVVEQASVFVALAASVRPVLVNCAAGVVVAPRGRPVAIAGFTVAHGQIVE